MSKSEKELRAEVKELRAKLKESNARLKEIDSGKLSYYAIIDGEVVALRADVLPKEGEYAYWEGEKGKKKLKEHGDFRKVVAEHDILSGFNCVRIKPILQKLGFTYDNKDKTWSKSTPAEAVETVVEAVE